MSMKLFNRRGLASMGVSLALVAFAGTAVFVSGGIPDAQAQPKLVGAEIMVLHATQVDGKGSIDPAVGNMPQLKKPPFSAYNTYKLLDKKSLPLEKGKSAEYPIVNGRVLQVTLVEVTPEKRYRISAAISQPGGPAFLKLLEVTAAPNEPFFVAGQSYQDGILVLGITLKP
jgi:hypothetical protein